MNNKHDRKPPKRPNKGYLFCFIAALLIAGGILLAQTPPSLDTTPNYSEARWYRSNSSGMALELIPSRLGALRNEYSLSVETISQGLPRVIPAVIRQYYNGSYRVELQLLYENGKEIRRQWIFRDSRGRSLLAASGSTSFFDENYTSASNSSNEGSDNAEPEGLDEKPEEVKRSGFIELRNNEGLVTREYQFDEDLAEWDFRYFYRDGILLRAETWFKEAPPPPPPPPPLLALDEEALDELEDNAAPIELPQQAERKEPVFALAFNDYYRYTRSGSLRALDRTIYEGAGERIRIGFPRLGPGITSDEEIITHAGVYTAAFFMGVSAPEGVTITYSFDPRGRVLGEIWRDENGKILGELKNTWSGERLQSVSWNEENEVRIIEYEYDRAGNPVTEHNYRNGTLERTVTFEDEREIEEIYMNGRLILRAYWENGLKIMEERVFSTGTRPQGTSTR